MGENGDGAQVGRASTHLAWPFLGVAIAGLVATSLPPDPPSAGHLVAMWGGLLVVVAAGAMVRHQSPSSMAATIPPLLFLGVVGVARDASGGSSSSLPALVGLPLLWLAVTGNRRQLMVVAVGVAAVFVLPVLLIGSPDYPPGDWRRAFLWILFSSLVAPVIQGYVQRLVRAEARWRDLVVAQRAHETAVSRANRRSEQLFADAPHGIALLDADGSVQRANAALASMLGVRPHDLTGRRLADLVRPAPYALRHLGRALAADEAVSDDVELATSHGQRVEAVLTTTVIADDAGARTLLTHVVDVSERLRYQAQLAHMADHDALTGLANRRLFDAELRRHLVRCSTNGPSGAVLLIDLDDFKLVNDTLGHAAGDELLVGLADLLRDTVRPSDVVARLGGDEFAVLLHEGDDAELAAVAHGVVETIATHTALLDGTRRRVTASAGLVTFAAAASVDTDILALADMTMYDAKESGRDRVVVLGADGGELPRTTAVLHWQRRVAEALAADEFELVVQPVLALRGPNAPMAEVLLRLRDGDRLVGPEHFLHIAERSGLAARIDAWVIRHAIPMLGQLSRELPGLRLAINLSGLSIGDPTVEEQLVRSLREHRIDPAAIVLEITETAAVRDLWRAREFATRIKSLGCRFALDDFGSGFGSFAYLKHLPFDYVKIDGEFIADLRTSSVNRVLLRSIVSVAEELGKATIAEHVGDDWTLDFLRRENVVMVQGFHVAEPVPPAALAGVLQGAMARVDDGHPSARLW
ncbi:putative bifunctional diguanylate cyclase/phosphodiesterase [Nocardioides sp.]|uniref:putative bifunctional diguanylate cyclase/phosphodiesterase n=1 Tax=Nocardioides sp. TaxID=35761 RepID=UPI003516D565